MEDFIGSEGRVKPDPFCTVLIKQVCLPSFFAPCHSGSEREPLKSCNAKIFVGFSIHVGNRYRFMLQLPAEPVGVGKSDQRSKSATVTIICICVASSFTLETPI